MSHAHLTKLSEDFSPYCFVILALCCVIDSYCESQREEDLDERLLGFSSPLIDTILTAFSKMRSCSQNATDYQDVLKVFKKCHEYRDAIQELIQCCEQDEGESEEMRRNLKKKAKSIVDL